VVPIKSVESRDIQALQRMRERQLKVWTALVNHICGLWAEDGTVIPQGVARIGQVPPALLEDTEDGLTREVRERPCQRIADSQPMGRGDRAHAVASA
jgi:hypothetical protein